MTIILDTLHQQHEVVKGIFQKIKSAKDNSEKEQLFMELKNNLAPHMKGEEKYIYPALEDDEQYKEIVLHGFEEHHAAKLFLKELEGMSPAGERWDAKVGVLSDMIDHHVESEESKIFKAAREYLSEEKMKDIGEKFESVTDKGKTIRLTRIN